MFAFAKAEPQARTNTNLLCSVYLDLPKALQAQIFATINSTQKRVDRSLTYELFGYNISEEKEEFWPPDKLAVFLTRKLSTDSASPLKGRITVAPKRDTALEELHSRADWKISTAVVVDGILRLFSNNPKRDVNAMRKNEKTPRRILVEEGPKDRSPLRDIYIEANDLVIYTMVRNYILACEEILWSNATDKSFIFKTVGVQALFDILRKLAPEAMEKRNISVDYFKEKLSDATEIDFASERFRNPSGSGRTLIRREIEDKIGLNTGSMKDTSAGDL